MHLTQTLGYYACVVIPGKLNLWNMYVLRHVSVGIKRTSAFQGRAQSSEQPHTPFPAAQCMGYAPRSYRLHTFFWALTLAVVQKEGRP